MQIEEKLQHDKDLIPGILKLVELLDKYKNYSNIEIEIRLGYIQEKYFDSNITNEYYKKINNTLNSFEDWSYNDNKTTTDYYDGNLRLSIDMEGNRSAMNKVRLTDIDIVYDSGPFDIRISVSQETPIDPNDVNNNNLKTSRNKTRITRIYDKWKFDLSEVTTENNNLKKKGYEFEIEIDNPFDTLKKYNNDSVYVAHSTLLKLRQVINMCEEPDDEDIISMEIISENFRNHPI